MKFSVNTHHNLKGITGWISIDGSPISIVAVLTRNGIELARSDCNLFREDVKNANLHSDGKCGFSFLSKELSLVEGNIYRVSFFNKRKKIAFKEIIFGHPLSLAKLFHAYEFLPRDDFSILNEPAQSLLDKSCDLIFLKQLIIRLRRGKRAHNSRLHFKGESYAYRDDDWIIFRSFVVLHIELILSCLHPRNVWSIVDTFADYSDYKERLSALSLSNILFQERFAQSMACIYEFHKKDKIVSHIQIPYWGGLTNRLLSDDAYDVFITRNLEVLENTPIIKRFFIYFLMRMINEKESFLNENILHSAHFKDMSLYYLHALEKYSLKASFIAKARRDFNAFLKKAL